MCIKCEKLFYAIRAIIITKLKFRYTLSVQLCRDLSHKINVIQITHDIFYKCSVGGRKQLHFHIVLHSAHIGNREKFYSLDVLQIN